MSADQADCVTSVGGTAYGVDPNGNLTQRGPDACGYDQANRLTSATVDTTTASYGYDGAGKRVSETVGGATTRNTYDLARGLPVLLQDGERKEVLTDPAGLNFGGPPRKTLTPTLGLVSRLLRRRGSARIRSGQEDKDSLCPS